MTARRLAGILFLASLASVAHAVDGVREINQVCAVQTGCFSGDSPGFPVSITTGGSYRLTGNLTVPANTDGVDFLADGIALDLNGFEIAGAVTCTGEGSSVSCSSGNGAGIEGSAHVRQSVENGRVRGFRYGMELGKRSQIRNLVVESNNSRGILTDAQSIVSGSIVYQNQGIGIAAVDVEHSIASGNLLDGIDSGIGCSLIGNVVRLNGRYGIYSSDPCVVHDNAVHDNGNDGIGIANGGSIVSDNTASANGGDGIEIQGGAGTTVQRNTLTSNATYGLNLGLALGATYRENTISGNGATVSGGIDMGANSCNATTTCP